MWWLYHQILFPHLLVSSQLVDGPMIVDRSLVHHVTRSLNARARPTLCSQMSMFRPIFLISPSCTSIVLMTRGANPSQARPAAKFRVGHERSCDGEHLLFAAAQLSSHVGVELLQFWKSCRPSQDSSWTLPSLSWHHDVLPNREVREDSPVIRNKADTELSNTVRRSPTISLPLNRIFPARGGVRPIMLLSVVVLPAPFLPEGRWILPL